MLSFSFLDLLPTIQEGSMKVLEEVPPVMDEKGEHTKVQVLKEGEIFDPDQFLDEMEQHLGKHPQCPCCHVPETDRTLHQVLYDLWCQ